MKAGFYSWILLVATPAWGEGNFTQAAIMATTLGKAPNPYAVGTAPFMAFQAQQNAALSAARQNQQSASAVGESPAPKVTFPNLTSQLPSQLVPGAHSGDTTEGSSADSGDSAMGAEAIAADDYIGRIRRANRQMSELENKAVDEQIALIQGQGAAEVVQYLEKWRERIAGFQMRAPIASGGLGTTRPPFGTRSPDPNSTTSSRQQDPLGGALQEGSTPLTYGQPPQETK